MFFGFTSDWFRMLREFFFLLVRELSKAKPNQMRIAFDTQLKTALLHTIKFDSWIVKRLTNHVGNNLQSTQNSERRT